MSVGESARRTHMNKFRRIPLFVKNFVRIQDFSASQILRAANRVPVVRMEAYGTQVSAAKSTPPRQPNPPGMDGELPIVRQ